MRASAESRYRVSKDGKISALNWCFNGIIIDVPSQCEMFSFGLVVRMLKSVFLVRKPDNVTYVKAVPHLLSFFEQHGSGKIICTKRLLRRYVPLTLNRSHHAGEHVVEVVNPGQMGELSDAVTCVISPGTWTEKHIGPEAFVGDGEQVLVVFSKSLSRFAYTPAYDARTPYVKRLLDADVDLFRVSWDDFAEQYQVCS